MRVTAGNAVKYAAMPGIFPRLKDILFSGFGPITQLVAIICFMVGLLPRNHPCFSKEHKDKYGLVRILAAAAEQVKFEWKHIDQITVFALIVCGSVMMCLYLVGLVVFLITSPAFAIDFTTLFVTQNPTNDMAFMMMDRVLGIPDLFNSSVSTTAPFPTPFQSGLHDMFAFYSMGIFFIALVIFLYHIVHIVLEVTQTGRVSEHLSDDSGDGEGGGFSWLPFRFVMAFGLLIPFGLGLNSAQWITLYTAKFGSGLATNAWIEYNTNTSNNPAGELNRRLITKPGKLDYSGLIKGLFMMRSCYHMHAWANGRLFSGSYDVVPYIVNGSNNKPLFNSGTTVGFMDRADDKGVGGYNASPQTIAKGDTSDDFIEILDFAGYNDITIVVGAYDSAEPLKYKQHTGKVLPVCGSVTIPSSGRNGESIFATEGYLFATLNVLFDVNRPSITTSSTEKMMFPALIREYMRRSAQQGDWEDRAYNGDVPQIVKDTYICGDPAVVGNCDGPVLASYWNTMMDSYYRHAFSVPPYSAYDFLADTDTAAAEIDPDGYYIFSTPTSFSSLGVPNPLSITTGILDRGWGGAGLWYNKITERNSSLYNAVMAVPTIGSVPLVMEETKKARANTDKKVSGGKYCDKFSPQKSGSSSINSVSEQSQFRNEETQALYFLCSQLFENEGLQSEGTTRVAKMNGPIERAIETIYSEFQLYNKDGNREVNPMAQMSSLGRILIDKSIIGIVASTGAYAMAGQSYASAAEKSEVVDTSTVMAGVAGDIIMTIAFLGMTSGFVLHYMIPLMPFMYFFFAVGRWVKVVFEALVGVPLWALAHLRVGGPGLPGSAASGGYFLLLEIFIRPILTVFSLIASFAIFSALTLGLNSVFALASENLFGGTAPVATGMTDMMMSYSRGVVDQFFLSTFYIAIVYVIATGSFKLIDLIPDNIMRWSGAGVQSMGASDVSDDMVDQWQWELPSRFTGVADEVKGSVRDMLLSKNEGAYAQSREEAKAKAIREAQNERIREARRNGQEEKAKGGGGTQE